MCCGSGAASPKEKPKLFFNLILWLSGECSVSRIGIFNQKLVQLKWQSRNILAKTEQFCKMLSTADVIDNVLIYPLILNLIRVGYLVDL